MPERINGGFALAAIGAVVLFVSLFLTWFEPSRTAWTVFEIEDLVLAALALFTLYAAANGISPTTPERSIPGSVVRYAGIAVLVIVVATLIQRPPGALHSAPQIGAWLALVAGALITIGGVLFHARVSIVVTLKPRDRTSTVRVAGRPEGTMPSAPEREEPEYDPDLEHEAESNLEPNYEADPEYDADRDPEGARTETQPIRDERGR
jgi:hypothetical protein